MNMTTLAKIDPKTAHDWIQDQTAVLIDVREADEYIKQHVPGAHLVPLSGFNPEDFPNEHDKIAVFHCMSGSRTEAAAGQILSTGFKQVYQLEGGMKSWQAAGLPVNQNLKAPISIMRQVQITAGSLVVFGIVLAALLHPVFILLSAFVGAGLIQAGMSGNCAMASVLGKMPWNRIIRGQKGTSVPASS